jgi:hypothetical protein
LIILRGIYLRACGLNMYPQINNSTRHFWFTSLPVFAGLLLLLSCTDAQQCAPGVTPLPRNAITGEICPTVGRMGGAKLAIPSEFRLGPVAYKGIDIWRADSYKNRPEHPTFDNEIDTFAIRIRQTNFRPIETEVDEREYRQSYETVWGLPPADNRWIHVGFDARLYPVSAIKTADGWYKDDAHWGPYVKAADVWGLAHYVSVQRPSTDAIHGDQVEYFYDAAGNSAFMFCRNTLRKVPPYDPLSHCEIDFEVPKLMARADITNIRDKADLAKWREMREGVLRVVDSFIVP